MTTLTDAASVDQTRGRQRVCSTGIDRVCLPDRCLLRARPQLRAERKSSDGRVLEGCRVAFTLAFAGTVTGSASIAINLGFTAAVILSYAWLTTVAFGLYHRARVEERERDNTAGGVRGRADEPSWRAEVA